MISQIIAANERIKAKPNAVRETPLEKSLSLSAQTGANIYLKYESLQLTGSFKLRGSSNKLNLLSDAEKAKGVITASTGNHGLGVATAASLLGIDATIYVPETASVVKLDAIRQLGGTVETVKGDGYLAEMTAKSVAEQLGKTYVSPYNDFDVVCGQGTCGLEIMQQLPDVDAIFVAVGGGGLIGGSGLYAKSVNPDVEIVGCWPEVARSFYEALELGKVVDIQEGETISDGTAGGVEHDTITLELCQKVIDTKVLVSEAEITDAMRLIAQGERQIIEGAAGVAVAAALKAINAEPVKYKGKNIAIVICGRNISFDKFLKAIGV
ncbi:MAG: serine/threonine dehydratase [Hyphomicrobiales bacterium]|nr:MAG: serine/threonine dehydratase [Hyphomicrobiales bacterium]